MASSSTMVRINEDQVRKAVKALLKWKKLQSKKTQKLSDLSCNEKEEEEAEVEDDFIYLLLTLKKTPPKELTIPHKICLPNPLVQHLDSLTNLCLIIDDRPRKIQSSKPKFNAEFVQKRVKAEGLPITKVLKLSKIKSDYKSFEAKQKLCGSYDMFLAERRVVHLLPSLLGKQFYKKKKKVPLPVDLRGDRNWKKEIESACSSTLLCLGNGTCSVVKVGRGFMGSSEVAENVLAAIEGIVGVVPKKMAGVRAFHLKFSDSLALPVYEALIDSKLKIEEGAKGTENGDKKKVGLNQSAKEVPARK